MGAKAAVQGMYMRRLKCKEGQLSRFCHSTLHYKLPLLITIHPDFLVSMAASADVLAQAKVEIDLAAIPEGKNVWINNSYDRRSASSHI